MVVLWLLWLDSFDGASLLLVVVVIRVLLLLLLHEHVLDLMIPLCALCMR